MDKITDGIIYVGVDDYDIDLFEGMYKAPSGMSYNSYAIIDKKIAVMDTVDENFCTQWLENVEKALNGKNPDYLIVNHMEPDHSANIAAFIEKYPDVKIVGNAKTFVMIEEFFGSDAVKNKIEVKDGEKLCLGKRTLEFVFAPMVHWPEVMMTYGLEDKALFSADAFGKFGARGANEKWDDEARRYYYGIVGKFGVQVQAVIKKLACREIEIICPLHGPVLSDNLAHYLDLYDKWSKYTPEFDGVLIAYTSVYGHTKKAAEILAETLKEKGVFASVCDLARCDRSRAVAEAFAYKKLVLATTTYNGGIFPAMREFIDCLTERNYQNRTVGLIENGSWAPVAANAIKTKMANCKNICFIEDEVKIRSALNSESLEKLNALANALINA